MRIDKPICGFANCRKCFDGNCTNTVEHERCEYLHYKDLEEKGRLIETPCEMRLGQKWFYIGFGIPIEFEIVDFGWWKTDGLGAYGYGDFPNMSKMFFPFSYFGKYVFLTKSEAERSRN